MLLASPVLSEFDPDTAAEGSLDPLSLGAMYERLADRILPALTVRMSRIRFATAIAVGAHVCDVWDEEDVAADGVTPPSIVFEWFLIEAFVRCKEELRQSEGALRIAGFTKVGNALRAHRAVSAPAYLKTPGVFGFTGIFRRFVEMTHVVTKQLRLDDAGYELVRAWEKDQGLHGFLDENSGPGADLRTRLRRAVEHGMEKGQTMDLGRPIWSEIATRLDPGRVGRAERRQLDALVRGSQSKERLGFAGELVAAIERHGEGLTRPEEPAFLRQLKGKASEGLAIALQAIEDFERLCRPLTDAFDLIRFLSSERSGNIIHSGDFVAHRSSSRLCKAIQEAVGRLLRSSTLLEWEGEAIQSLGVRYGEVQSEAELFDAILSHHEAAQAVKPPEGKRPWLERGARDGVAVRTAYQVEEPPARSTDYTHDYRTPTLSAFLGDLGRIS